MTVKSAADWLERNCPHGADKEPLKTGEWIPWKCKTCFYCSTTEHYACRIYVMERDGKIYG